MVQGDQRLQGRVGKRELIQKEEPKTVRVIHIFFFLAALPVLLPLLLIFLLLLLVEDVIYITRLFFETPEQRLQRQKDEWNSL